MKNLDYPDNFIRGMSNKEQCISEEGFVLAGAFQFDAYDPKKNAEYCELSINWCDDDDAIDTAFNQINARTAQPQFTAGLAKNDRKMMEIFLKSYFIEKFFSYEREPIEEDYQNSIQENRYHGNLLLKHNVSKGVKKLIPNALAALASDNIITR